MNNAADTELPWASQTSDILTEVALNPRWSWNHSADQLWERLQGRGLLVRPPGSSTVSRQHVRKVRVNHA